MDTKLRAEAVFRSALRRNTTAKPLLRLFTMAPWVQKSANTVLKLASMLLIYSSIHDEALAQHGTSDHLEPIAPYSLDSYNQVVFDTLIARERAELWMICEPSFAPESALILRSNLAAPKLKDPFSSVESREWVLESVTASKQIWHWNVNPDGSENLDILRKVQVERKTIEVKEPLVNALRQAWIAVLRQTRYSEANSVAIDGTTYQFFCGPNLFGEVSSPKAGVPADLVKLTAILLKLVQSAPESRDALLKESFSAAQQVQYEAKAQLETDRVQPPK